MIPITISQRIKKKAIKLIQRHGTNDVFEICDTHNISILYDDLGTIDGFLQFHENHYLIHINRETSSKEIVIAHELGHFFLHKHLNSFIFSKCSIVLESKLEHQANIFATELTLPDELIFSQLPYIQNHTMEQMAAYFNIPLFILEYKIKNLNSFSESSMLVHT
ncbi:MAG: ImmA/IrrE family metallo-endopeptidase [Bacillota bacterium]